MSIVDQIVIVTAAYAKVAVLVWLILTGRIRIATRRRFINKEIAAWDIATLAIVLDIVLVSAIVFVGGIIK